MRNRKKKDARYDAPYEMTDKEAEIRAATSYVPRKSSRNGATIFSVAVFLLACMLVLLAWTLVASSIDPAGLLVALLAGFFLYAYGSELGKGCCFAFR